MNFVRTRPDVVRSVTQRWLLNYWHRLRRDRPCPNWDDVDTGEFRSQADTVMFCDVTPDTSPPRFRIRHLGASIARAYGGDRRGELLDDVLPPVWLENALATYREAVRGRLPVYNAVDTRDGEGRLVHLERLLLPFCRNGGPVDRVLASIETVSLDGKFDQRGLADSPYASRGCALVAVIENS
jgi:hypothetical protein